MECCVLLKYTTNTAVSHLHQLDETPVGPGVNDDGRKVKKQRGASGGGLLGELRMMDRKRRSGKYDLVEAEKKFKCEAGTYQRRDNAPASEGPPAAEEQPEQDVLGKGHIMRNYKIGPKLGSGGFGLVCEGTRNEDELKVAVKFSVKAPNMPNISVPGHPNRLPLEIGLTLMANKGPSAPQIIQLLDWEEETDHYIMVMERPSPCMDLLSFMELHGGISRARGARSSCGRSFVPLRLALRRVSSIGTLNRRTCW
ncbi:serine/threonine-protein kinase pim-1-like [Puntigrus tetrazona]|uniref:serine/threonine-protein kinase pim-1-like n=1 Tax=Puntigrus tetrazona TaxID=1606681 RepID=UPI001C88E24A|nr:serine/threonine-protein kinase pim-1-like [Puntigrus tetrazona]